MSRLPIRHPADARLRGRDGGRAGRGRRCSSTRAWRRSRPRARQGPPLARRADDLSALVAARTARRRRDRREPRTTFAQVIGPDGRVVDATAERLGRAAPVPGAARAGRRGPMFVDRRACRAWTRPARMLALPARRAPCARRGRHAREPRRDARQPRKARSSSAARWRSLLASLGGYVLAGAALRPIEAMRRRAAEISRRRSTSACPSRRRDDEVVATRPHAQRDARPARGRARARAPLRRRREPRAADSARAASRRARAGAAPRRARREELENAMRSAAERDRPAVADRRRPARPRARRQGALRAAAASRPTSCDVVETVAAASARAPSSRAAR